MKRLFSILTVACMMLAFVAAFPAAAAADKSAATAVSGWDEIFNANSAADGGGGRFVLSADITVPAGKTLDWFFGEIDGAGHTVTVEDTMFAQLGAGAYIHDMTIVAKDSTPVNFTPFCLRIEAEDPDEPIVLVNLTNYVNIDTTQNASDADDCSGFVAVVQTSGSVFMLNCVNYGTINSGEQVGGLLSRTWVDGSGGTYTFINCANHGNISGAINHSGGFMGCMDGGTNNIYMNGCVNTGDVSSTTTSCGGLIGYISGKNSEIVIENCYSQSNLKLARTETDEKYNTSGLVSRVSKAASIKFKNCLVGPTTYEPANNNASYIVNYVNTNIELIIENCFYVDAQLGEKHAGSSELDAAGTGVVGAQAVNELDLSEGSLINKLNGNGGNGWTQRVGVDSVPVPATVENVELPLKIAEETTAPVQTDPAPADETTADPGEATEKQVETDAAPEKTDTVPEESTAGSGSYNKRGCSSAAGIGSAVILLLGVAVIFKKR